jgi:hypothetical protein
MPVKTTKKKREATRSEQYRNVYANSIQLQVNVWDFRVVFGEIQDSTDEAIRIEEQVRVTMSPQHTKAFLDLLSTHVQKYEAAFGEIRTSPINNDVKGLVFEEELAAGREH